MIKKFLTLPLAALLIATLLLTFGCSKKSERFSDPSSSYGGGRVAEAGNTYKSLAKSDQAFRMEDSLWEGVGYSEELAAPSKPSVSDGSSAPGGSSILEPPVERKLVKSASVRIRVENLNDANISITNTLEKFNAYSASTIMEENYFYYSLRVPSSLYEVFLAEMDGMGRTLQRSESTEDVTVQYYDLEGRLATKKELLKTFQSYLGRARNIEEILSVERRISELQYDIEGTGKQLRVLADRVDYATIELTLLGPVASTPYQGDTFGERIKEMFSGFGDFLSTIVLVIIGVVIYGIPIFLLIAVLFWLFFGKIGLARKFWRIVAAKKQG